MRRFLLAWLPAAAVALGIIAASSVPSAALPTAPAIPYLDKLIHAAVYTLLAAAIARGLGLTTSLGAGQKIVLTVIIAVVFGISDEWHQSFVAGRQPSLGDLFADAFGALLGSVWAARRTTHRGNRGDRDGDHSLVSG